MARQTGGVRAADTLGQRVGEAHGSIAAPMPSDEAVCRGGSVCGSPKNACALYRAIRRSKVSSWCSIVAVESSSMTIVTV